MIAGLAFCGTESDPQAREVGSPLLGLSRTELGRFEAGRSLFSHVFSPEEGIGPRFNENACNACHTDPADGGTGEQLVVKATRYSGEGVCDLLIPHGGENVRALATPLLRSLGGGATPVPEDATHVGRFNVPFLFGLGLVDAIGEEDLVALEDPEDADGDGISGRLGRDAAGAPARFGRKGDVATLADFVDGASRLEMGLTTARHPGEESAGAIPPVPPGSDPAADPELTSEAVDLMTDFVRFLAPPERRVPEDRLERDRARRGEDLFAELGCANCHVPELQAGASEVRAISGQPIRLYSDLLLHDMGPAFQGSCGPGASPTEYRTEPLMGLGRRRAFLHDNRAGRVIDAILSHGGEAQSARDLFALLDRVSQELVLVFLATL